MDATQCLQHIWLMDTKCDNALSKRNLKRYVIKRRWIRAVNTIIALRRMGAKLEKETQGF